MVLLKNRPVVLIAAAILCAACFMPDARAAIPATVRWEDLSDRDVSAEAKAALSSDPGPWLHAESAHFIYHFVDAKLAETVLLHAEETYGWIKPIFGVAEDAWKRKVHIFIFEKKDAWDRFIERVGSGTHPGAFTTGWELFQYRDSFWLAPQHTLAHEVTHIVAFRFLKGPIPIFLDEGLSEYIATRAAARQTGGDQYAVRTLGLIPESDYIPLAELSSFKAYPAEDRIRTFYHESELLVRFLILENKGDFRAFLEDVSSGTVWHRALEGHYGIEADALEDGFRKYSVLKKK